MSSSWVWDKEGGNQAELSRDRYFCLSNSQQRVFNAEGATDFEVNGQTHHLAGYAKEEVVTNETLFNACMNARGWYLREILSQQ